MESIVESSAGSFEYDQVLGVKETMVSYIYCLLLFLFHFLHAVVLFSLLHKKDCIHLCYSPPGYKPNQIVNRNFISVTTHGCWSHLYLSLYICCGLNFISFCFNYQLLPYHKTKGNKIYTKDKIAPQHIYLVL